MLASAVHDLAGNTLEVFTLMPGGSCPGSFDLTPEHARVIARAVLFLRHESQGSLDRPAEAAGIAPSAIVNVPAGGALTIPAVYADWCARLGPVLAPHLPATARGELGRRVSAIAVRAAQAEHDARTHAAPLLGRPVLVAHFQADFVRWAGLTVAAVYPPGDDPPARALAAAAEQARARRAAAIVGNLPNGRRAPDSLGESLHLPVIMLGNFPTSGEAGACWTLLNANLRALLDGLAPSANRK
jgi:zinc transport system substrate-binding protein